MFEIALPDPSEMHRLDGAALVAVMQDSARAAAAAEARTLAAIAEFVRQQCTDEHPDWACDDWDAAAAEVSAALTIGHRTASARMDLAVSLRDRLPKVGALFLAGDITARIADNIAERVYFVQDAKALAKLDTVIAERATAWGPLSKYKLEQAVDVWVDQIDPAALRRTRANVRQRDFTVGDPDEKSGTTPVWGRLLASDAALFDARLKAMVHGVCDDDPRSLPQRRSDAVGALGAGADHLACRCGSPACPASADDGRATSVVIHVVAEQESLAAEPDPFMHGEEPEPEPVSEPKSEPAPAEPEPEPPSPQEPPLRRKAGLIPGGGIVPAPLLAELIAHGATVTPVRTPSADPEPHYRPSKALALFVRTRDLTCRYPGCDRPAELSDLDHTIPYPHGLTHAGGLGCKCRKHHLLKVRREARVFRMGVRDPAPWVVTAA